MGVGVTGIFLPSAQMWNMLAARMRLRVLVIGCIPFGVLRLPLLLDMIRYTTGTQCKDALWLVEL